MVTPLPASTAGAAVSAQPKREVSFHFVVTDPGPGAAAAAAPVCVRDTRHVTSCGREACDALDPGKQRTAMFTPACICITTKYKHNRSLGGVRGLLLGGGIPGPRPQLRPQLGRGPVAGGRRDHPVLVTCHALSGASAVS